MENGYLDHSYGDRRPLASNHKRSLSGGILSRLPFLRPSFEELVPAQECADELTRDVDNAPASPVRQVRTRKRKGSLRKTALLGTGKKRLERRSSKSSTTDATRSPPHARNAAEYTRDSMETVRGGQNNSHARSSSQRFSFEEEESTYAGSSTTTVSSNWTSLTEPPPLGLDISSDMKEEQRPSSLTSPVTKHPYASTTDDDEGLIFATSTSLAPPTPHTHSLTRTRSSRPATTHSHIASTPITPLRPPSPPVHDYSETEWWGWIILLLTWITFVVGMGSCLGVWSWAWDVGETPYAPPELEDDPTLPIVGYYPALIVMTGVMAWVWVVVAWVGMKYFRHARVWDGDD